MLRLEGLSRKVAEQALLRGVDFVLEPAERVSFLGPTGSGKTSLLRLIMGLDLPDEGRVLWHEQLLAEAGKNHCPPHERGFSLVFQQAVLLPFQSVDANIHLGVPQRCAKSRARAEELYALLELEGLQRRSAWKLSGGEQQRVAIARSLMIAPRLLLLDEPFNNLDAPFKAALFPALERYLSEQRISTIFVTHDRHEAFFFSQRICVINQGQLLQCDAPERLYQQPQSQQAAALLGTCNALEPAEAEALFGQGESKQAALPARVDGLVLIRPEQLALSEQAPHNGELTDNRFHGAHRLLRFCCDDGPTLTISARPDSTLELGARYRVHLLGES